MYFVGLKFENRSQAATPDLEKGEKPRLLAQPNAKALRESVPLDTNRPAWPPATADFRPRLAAGLRNVLGNTDLPWR